MLKETTSSEVMKDKVEKEDDDNIEEDFEDNKTE